MNDPGGTSHRSTGYRPLFELARGGIGAVTLVVKRDRAFERLYAMKTLHAHYRTEPTIHRMFLDEARIAGLIRHPNVVSVIDVGEGADGPFLVMDFVEGLSLGQLVRAAPEGGHFPVSLCARVGLHVAQGLHAAHELRSHEGEPLQIVHRDVSPQNILIGFDGTVRVTDFGIAKALSQQDQTATGILKGKLGYMAPEQLRFQRPDRRTDLYALGVVLFEMLSGTRLYSGGVDSDVPQRILFGPVPDISEHRRDVPSELVSLLMELLAKEPDHRPANGEEVASRLETICEGDSELQLGVRAYLDHHFSESKEKQRTKIAGALKADPQKAVVSGQDPPAEAEGALRKEASAGEPEELHPLQEPESVDVTPFSRTSKAPWLVAAGVLAALAVSIGAWAMTNPSEASTPNDTPEPAGPQVAETIDPPSAMSTERDLPPSENPPEPESASIPADAVPEPAARRRPTKQQERPPRASRMERAATRSAMTPPQTGAQPSGRNPEGWWGWEQ
ncbi:MAG: serine/threonine-protein kinase [Myxococcota bacterium]